MPGSTVIGQTLVGSFLDLMQNARDLPARCGLSHVPEVCSDTCQALYAGDISLKERGESPLQASMQTSAGVKVSCCCSLL